MAEILTTNFKNDTVRKFVSDATANEYFVFVSGIESVTPVNSIKSKNEFLSKTLFGKRIRPEDTKYMIRYYPWQNGEVYVQYDDQEDLEGEKFYAIVGPTNNDTGDYRVFKCLFNNYGGEVSSPPAYDPTVTDQIYRTADDYVWKYMYVISLVEFEAYNALGYVPITGTFAEDPTPVTGGSPLSDIFIENKDSNLGYAKKSGALAQTPFSDGTVVTLVDASLSPVQNYYSGQWIYFTNANQSSYLYEIDTYEFNSITKRASIRVKDNDPTDANAGLPGQDGVLGNAAFTIFPKIEIIGDGTGAKAIPVISNEGRIVSIQVLDFGSGYNSVSARVVDPQLDFNPDDPTSTDVRADIRAVLAPQDGHSFNLIDELKCRHALLYGYITGDDNSAIGATNTYNGVGIVREPTFDGPTPEIFDNRIAVTSDDTNLLTVNSTITQVDADNNIIFSGTVHEVDLVNNIFYIAEYAGPYTNQPGSDISLDLTKNFRNQTGQLVQINSPAVDNVVTSSYTQRTGKIYYMEDFFPLSRNDLSREEFKIVFEF